MKTTDPEPCPTGRPIFGEKVTPPSEPAQKQTPVGPYGIVYGADGRPRTTKEPK